MNSRVSKDERQRRTVAGSEGDDGLSPRTCWSRTAADDRIALLHRLADWCDGNVSELAESLAREIGKPLRFSRVEAQRSAEMLRAIAAHGRRFLADEPVRQARLRRRPQGMVAVITPWNNPLYIALGKLAPAVLYGNTVIWKPAPEAHALAERLLHGMHAAGWPAGLVELLAGDRIEGEALLNDPRIAAATLTGSPAAGDAAHRICTRRRIPLQAEVGGNNPAIVWTDADLDLAARQIAAGAYDQAGQRCTANRRVIVHADCRDEMIERLMRAAAELSWGDPLDTRTRIGPLVSAAQRDRVAAMVERAIADCGASRLPHGKRLPSSSCGADAFYPPTLLVCDDPAAEIVQEETFGPVLVVQTARDWDHAMQLANGVRQGLVSALFSRSSDTIARFLDEAQAGMLKVNAATADADVDVPFGGWKASTIGPFAHGVFDVEFFTRPQVIYGLDQECPPR